MWQINFTSIVLMWYMPAGFFPSENDFLKSKHCANVVYARRGFCFPSKKRLFNYLMCFFLYDFWGTDDTTTARKLLILSRPGSHRTQGSNTPWGESLPRTFKVAAPRYMWTSLFTSTSQNARRWPKRSPGGEHSYLMLLLTCLFPHEVGESN